MPADNEGEKGENQTVANISVYTVTFQQVSIDLIYVYIHTCICMTFGSVRKLASGSCVAQKSPKTNKQKQNQNKRLYTNKFDTFMSEFKCMNWNLK